LSRRKRILLGLLSLLLACLLVSPASAHYRENCWIKFRYRHVWSEVFPVICDYYTGEELNAAGGPHRFARYKAYVIVAGEGGDVLIRIDQPLRCGFVAEDSCAEQISHLLTGRDEFRSYRRGREVTREWAICQPGVLGHCSAKGFFNEGIGRGGPFDNPLSPSFD
jgi:hypothetical protein